MAYSSVEDSCPYGHRCQPHRIDTIGKFVIYHYQCGECGAVWTSKPLNQRRRNSHQTTSCQAPDSVPGLHEDLGCGSGADCHLLARTVRQPHCIGGQVARLHGHFPSRRQVATFDEPKELGFLIDHA